jgi:hypothetical protein
MLHDGLGLFLIKHGELGARSSFDAEQLIKFGVNGLRVAMLRSLEEHVVSHVPTVATDCQSKLRGLKISHATTYQSRTTKAAGCELRTPSRVRAGARY